MTKRDPGLQPERTALAWGRTALAMFVNGALLARAAAQADSPGLWTVAGLVVLASAILFAAGAHRQRTLMLESVPRAPHAAFAFLLVGAVWVACAAAVVSAVR